MTKAESRKRTADEEISGNALGRRTENLVSGNDRAVAVVAARGNVDSGPHRSSGRIGRNAPPDSGWPEHPDTDHHLPQVWDEGARGGTACQRARLDPGVGPVRNRRQGSDLCPGKGVGTIPQAAPAGQRRKSLGRGPAKLLALKIAGRGSRPRTCESEFCEGAHPQAHTGSLWGCYPPANFCSSDEELVGLATLFVCPFAAGGRNVGRGV